MVARATCYFGGSVSVGGASLTTLRAAVRSACSLKTLNWVTASFMVAFHVLAIATMRFVHENAQNAANART